MTQDDLDSIEYGLKAMLLVPNADGKTFAKGYKEADEWFYGGISYGLQANKGNSKDEPRTDKKMLSVDKRR